MEVFMIKEVEAANKISGLAAKELTLQEMKSFQNSYANIGRAFDNSALAVLSTINLKELDEFQKWKPSLLNNIDKILPLIISKMLNGDIMAFSVYKEISPNVISYDTVHSNKNIAKELQKYGGAEDGLAIVNAIHWLETIDATDIFGNFPEGRSVECKVNDMLGVNNEFITCEHKF